MTDSATKDTLFHITDLHFWKVLLQPWRLMNKRLLGNANVYLRRRHDFHMDRAEEFARHMLKAGSGGILFGGDFTSTATDEEFLLARRFVDLFLEAERPVYVMPGNHDVYTFESVRKQRFERYFHDLIPEGGYPCRIDLPGGTPLILAPTVTPNFLSSKGRIRAKEVEAVRQLLADCPSGPILVAGHYPVLHRTHAYDSPPSRRLRKAEALHAVLGGTGQPTLYVAGHVHRFSYVQDPGYPNLRHVTTPAFFLKRRKEPTQGAFSEIQVQASDFVVYQHVCEEVWRRDSENPRHGHLTP